LDAKDLFIIRVFVKKTFFWNGRKKLVDVFTEVMGIIGFEVFHWGRGGGVDK
jgi:hypothetical protein